MSETLIDHVNCKVEAFPNLLRIVAYCKDKATFKRIANAFSIQFGTVEIDQNNLQVIVNCDDQEDYEYGLLIMDVAKKILQASEPEKMGSI